MAQFRIETGKVSQVAGQIGTRVNEMNRIHGVLQEAYVSARGAWSCATADQFFGQLSKALESYPNMVTAIGNLSTAMNRAAGNYEENEGQEKDQMQNVMKAFR